MKKHMILRMISLAMLIGAVVFLAFALTHPEAGTVFHIGNLAIGSAVWRAFYAFYAIVMVGLFVISCVFAKREKKVVKE